MPIYSSDSDDDHPRHPVKLFRRERSLHEIFGSGKVADMLLWKDKTLSGSILAGLTITWFLFEIAEFHLVTLLCYVIMTMMLVLFLWNSGSHLINRRPPSIQDIQLSGATVGYVTSKINWFLALVHKISSGEDLARFIVTLASLWLLSIIGSYSGALNLIYISFFCLITVPVMYEKYENEVDYIATQGSRDMRRLYKMLDSRVLSKIPRGPVKDKKFK